LAARASLAPGEGEAELTSIRKKHPPLIVQLMTLEDPPGPRAISMIGLQTLRAAKSGGLLATKPEVDLLLRMSGTSQIAVAMEKAGYRAKGKKLLIAIGDPGELKSLRRQIAKDARYEILEERPLSKRDLEAVERAALLGTRS